MCEIKNISRTFLWHMPFVAAINFRPLLLFEIFGQLAERIRAKNKQGYSLSGMRDEQLHLLSNSDCNFFLGVVVQKKVFVRSFILSLFISFNLSFFFDTTWSYLSFILHTLFVYYSSDLPLKIQNYFHYFGYGFNICFSVKKSLSKCRWKFLHLYHFGDWLCKGLSIWIETTMEWKTFSLGAAYGQYQYIHLLVQLFSRIITNILVPKHLWATRIGTGLEWRE